jgi:hypothetical protein
VGKSRKVVERNRGDYGLTMFNSLPKRSRTLGLVRKTNAARRGGGFSYKMQNQGDTTIVAIRATEKTVITIRLRRLGTGVDAAENTPEDFALLPNYPNPFSATHSSLQAGTQFSFRLPQPKRVQVEIFNIHGQRVRTLLNAVQEQGQRTIWWNSADDAGRPVAAGVYILRLRAGKVAAARRMVLLR